MPQLDSHSQSIGDTVARRISVWVGFIGALIFLIIGLILLGFDKITILNGCETAIIVMMVVFQQGLILSRILLKKYLEMENENVV